MKNILMVGTSLQTMGGIASVVNVYASAGIFRRYGVRYLATHCDGGALDKLRIMFGAYLSFLLLLLRGRVGLVHVHVASRASFWRKSLFFLLAFLFRVPAILHLHGGGFAAFYQECGPLRRRLIRHVFDRAAQVLVLSEGWRRWVGTISGNPRVATLFNPVIMPPSMPEWSARRHADLLFLGKMGPAKGTYDLLDALPPLGAGHPQMRLLLGGDGEQAQVRARADALGLGEKVALLGWVQSEAKAQLLGGSGVYVLPSYFEGLPMSILEAMAAGMPIISTPVGGIPEAVSDGVEGFLVPPGDVAALGERIARLLADPALAQRMGAAGRRRVESTFSSEAVLPQLERIYNELGFLPV